MSPRGVDLYSAASSTRSPPSPVRALRWALYISALFQKSRSPPSIRAILANASDPRGVYVQAERVIDKNGKFFSTV
jgi:hypothetical protein